MKVTTKKIERASNLESKADGATTPLNRKQKRFLDAINKKLERK